MAVVVVAAVVGEGKAVVKEDPLVAPVAELVVAEKVPES